MSIFIWHKGAHKHAHITFTHAGERENIAMNYVSQKATRSRPMLIGRHRCVVTHSYKQTSNSWRKIDSPCPEDEDANNKTFLNSLWDFLPSLSRSTKTTQLPLEVSLSIEWEDSDGLPPAMLLVAFYANVSVEWVQWQHRYRLTLPLACSVGLYQSTVLDITQLIARG